MFFCSLPQIAWCLLKGGDYSRKAPYQGRRLIKEGALSRKCSIIAIACLSYAYSTGKTTRVFQLLYQVSMWQYYV